MAEGFERYEDTRMRLHKTICMYDNKPVYVVCDDQKMDVNNIYVYPLTKINVEGHKKKIKVTDKKFSYRAIALGYVNYDIGAYFVSRIPYRQNQAGLTVYQVRVTPHINPAHIMYTKGMEDSILNSFPSGEKALHDVVRGVIDSVAFSKHFAIRRMEGSGQIGLYYRTRLLGLYNTSAQKFSIITAADTSFIRILLQKQGVEVH